MVLEPKEFIKQKVNFNNILKARQQHKDLSYFTQSSLQEDITLTYLEQWAQRKYASNDKFLNWVKTVFKTDNFLSFYKYLRFPLSSAKIVNDDIKTQLKRVFHADDSIFKYNIKGIEYNSCDELCSEHFDDELFNAILFNHNSVVVQDIDLETKRYREIVSINQIVSIECDSDKIHRIAYHSALNYEGQELKGYSYIDKDKYSFFDHEFRLILEIPHDLGECPVDWISSENMFNENNVVKKSIFSYVINDFEEFVFLKTLQRMTEPNGAIPVTTKLKTKENKIGGDLGKTESDKEPMSSATLQKQNTDFINVVPASESQLQTGTIVSVAPTTKPDGGIDMDVVKHYFQFHYLPVDSLKYLNERIKEIENNIIASVLGDYEEQNSSAKNELQVSKGYDTKEDKLRWFAKELSRIKKRSDYKTLALLYGKDRVSVEVFFGTDFFTESVDDLYKSFKLAPNAIERRKILKRLSQVKNKHNLSQAQRDKILYMIIPYATDNDFEVARTQQINPETFEMQTRFDYWVSMFEVEYGPIENFYEGLGEEMKDSSKIIIITNLIKNIIKNEQIPSNA